MPRVLSLVNTASSTSIPVEIAAAVNSETNSQVTIGSMFQDVETVLDPDLEAMDLPIEFFGGDSNFDPEPYWHLQRHLHRHEYDIVHTHHNFTGSISRLIARLGGLSLVNTEHNDHRFFSLPQRAANGATYMLPDVNVYNSKATQNSLDPITKVLSRTDKVIYNGIDLGRISEGASYELPVDVPDKTIVTNVGVMTEQKNQHVILKAVQHLVEKNQIKNLHFVIAGSGPLEADLRATAKDLNIQEHVQFTGYLPEREHVYRLLHESDIFLTPSQYEGFCVAAVEAMACRLPIIATDSSVFREVIGPNGRFVPRKRSDCLANAITEFVENLGSDSMASRRDALCDRAINTFPLEKTARQYHDLYCDVLD